MECVVNKASMYTLYHVDIVGSGISISRIRILYFVDIVGSSVSLTM